MNVEIWKSSPNSQSNICSIKRKPFLILLSPHSTSMIWWYDDQLLWLKSTISSDSEAIRSNFVHKIRFCQVIHNCTQKSLASLEWYVVIRQICIWPEYHQLFTIDGRHEGSIDHPSDQYWIFYLLHHYYLLRQCIAQVEIDGTKSGQGMFVFLPPMN